MPRTPGRGGTSSTAASVAAPSLTHTHHTTAHSTHAPAVEERSVVEQFHDELSDVRCAAYVGGRVWTSAKGGELVVRDPRGKVLAVVDETDRCGRPSCISVVGSTVWVGYSVGVIKVYSAATAREIKQGEFKRHSGAVNAIAHSGHGRSAQVFSGSADFMILQWTRDFRLSRQLPGHGGGVRALVCRGRTLLSASDDGTFRVWDVESGESLHRIHASQSGVHCLIATNDHVWTGGEDGLVQVWDRTTLNPIATLQEHEGSVSTLVHMEVEDEVWSGSSDHTICVWSSQSFALLRRLPTHAGYIAALVKVVAQREYSEVWSLGADKVINVWGFGAGGYDTEECQRLREDLAATQESFCEQREELVHKYQRMGRKKDDRIALLNQKVEEQAEELFDVTAVQEDLQRIIVEKEKDIERVVEQRFLQRKKDLEEEMAVLEASESEARRQASFYEGKAASSSLVTENFELERERNVGMKRRVSELEDEVSRLSVAVATRGAEKDTMKAHHEATVRELHAEISEKDNRLSVLMNETERAAVQLAEATEGRSSAETRLARHNARPDADGAEGGLQKRLAASEAAREGLARDCDELRELLEQQNEYLRHVKERNRALEKEVERTVGSSAAGGGGGGVGGAGGGFASETRDDDETERLKATVAELEALLATAEAERDNALSDDSAGAEDREHEARALKQTIAQLEDMLAKAEDERDAVSADLHSLQRIAASREQRGGGGGSGGGSDAEAEDELAELRHALSQLELTLDNTSNEMMDVKRENDSLRSRLAATATAASPASPADVAAGNLETEADLRTQLSAAEARMSRVQAELAEAQLDAGAEANENYAKTRRISELEAKVDVLSNPSHSPHSESLVPPGPQRGGDDGSSGEETAATELRRQLETLRRQHSAAVQQIAVLEEEARMAEDLAEERLKRDHHQQQQQHAADDLDTTGLNEVSSTSSAPSTEEKGDQDAPPAPPPPHHTKSPELSANAAASSRVDLRRSREREEECLLLTERVAELEKLLMEEGRRTRSRSRSRSGGGGGGGAAPLVLDESRDDAALCEAVAQQTDEIVWRMQEAEDLSATYEAGLRDIREVFGLGDEDGGAHGDDDAEADAEADDDGFDAPPRPPLPGRRSGRARDAASVKEAIKAAVERVRRMKEGLDRELEESRDAAACLSAIQESLDVEAPSDILPEIQHLARVAQDHGVASAARGHTAAHGASVSPESLARMLRGVAALETRVSAAVALAFGAEFADAAVGASATAAGEDAASEEDACARLEQLTALCSDLLGGWEQLSALVDGEPAVEALDEEVAALRESRAAAAEQMSTIQDGMLRDSEELTVLRDQLRTALQQKGSGGGGGGGAGNAGGDLGKLLEHLLADYKEAIAFISALYDAARTRSTPSIVTLLNEKLEVYAQERLRSASPSPEASPAHRGESRDGSLMTTAAQSLRSEFESVKESLLSELDEKDGAIAALQLRAASAAAAASARAEEERDELERRAETLAAANRELRAAREAAERRAEEAEEGLAELPALQRQRSEVREQKKAIARLEADSEELATALEERRAKAERLEAKTREDRTRLQELSEALEAAEDAASAARRRVQKLEGEAGEAARDAAEREAALRRRLAATDAEVEEHRKEAEHRRRSGVAGADALEVRLERCEGERQREAQELRLRVEAAERAGEERAAALQRRLDEAEAERAGLLYACDERVRVAETCAEDVRRRLAAAEDRLGGEAEAEAAAASHKQDAADVRELRSELRREAAHAAEHARRLDEANAHAATLSTRLSALQAEYAAADAERGRLDDASRPLAHRAEVAERDAAALRTRAEEAETALRESRKETRRVQAELQRAQQKQEDAELFAAELEEVVEQSRVRKGELHELRRKLSAAEEDAGLWKVRAGAAEGAKQSNHSMEAELLHVKRERDSLQCMKHRYEEAERQLAELEAQHDGAQRKEAGEMRALQKELRRSKAQVLELQGKASDAEADLEELARRQEELRDAKAELLALRKKLSTLEAEVAVARAGAAELPGLQEKADAAEQHARKLTKEVAAAQAAVERVEDEAAQLLADKDGYKEQLQVAQEKAKTAQLESAKWKLEVWVPFFSAHPPPPLLSSHRTSVLPPVAFALLWCDLVATGYVY